MLELEVVVRDVKSQRGTNFKSYSCYKDGEYLCGLKLVGDCKPLTKSGIIWVKEENIFLDKKNKDFTTYCIKDFEKWFEKEIYIRPKELPFNKVETLEVEG